MAISPLAFVSSQCLVRYTNGLFLELGTLESPFLERREVPVGDCVIVAFGGSFFLDFFRETTPLSEVEAFALIRVCKGHGLDSGPFFEATHRFR